METYIAAPVLQVKDLDQAMAYYQDVLGFSEDFRFGDYAGIKFGEVCFHLCAQSIHHRPIGSGTVYIFCDAVDDYFAEIKAKGAHIVAEPQNYPYGMRDFAVRDPDGNQIAYGAEIKGGA